MFHKIMTCVLSAYALYSIARTLYDGKFRFILDIWKRFTLRMTVETVVQALVVIPAIVYLSSLPVLRWGWMKLVTGSGGNMIFAPVDLLGSSTLWGKVVYVVFGLALTAVIPFLAFYEEHLFRLGKLSWRSIAVSSVFFGLVHTLVGVPLGAAFGMIFGGLFLGYQYRRACRKAYGQGLNDEQAHGEALLTSTAYHTLHNTLAVWLGILIAVLL